MTTPNPIPALPALDSTNWYAWAQAVDTAVRAVAAKADLAVTVTGGPTRVSGGALHLWNDPAVDPGSNAQQNDLWVGELL